MQMYGIGTLSLLLRCNITALLKVLVLDLVMSLDFSYIIHPPSNYSRIVFLLHKVVTQM